MSRLQEKYQNELAGEIQKKLGLKNPMEVPKITKITINMGVGGAVADKKVMEKARGDMEKIAGQKPVTTLSRKSVAAFKIRDNMPIGCKVTLRRERMYEFLDRLVNIAIPRIRDFRGLNPKSFDQQGNYSMGVQEQIFSRKSTMTKSTCCVVWTSSLPHRHVPQTKVGRFWKRSTFRSRNKESIVVAALSAIAKTGIKWLRNQ